MTAIPKALQPHINTAFPGHTCLVASVLPSGYAQVTPRGSVFVYDDDHLMLWERGKGSTTANLTDGSKLTVYFQNADLRTTLLPAGGVARFYGEASIHREGEVYERVWEKLVDLEKQRDPDKKGFAVLIRIDRAEDLRGEPLAE